MQLQAVWLHEELTSSRCRLPSIWRGRCWLRDRANPFKLTPRVLVRWNPMAPRQKLPSRRHRPTGGPPEASRGPLGTNFGSLLDLIWNPFWNSRRLIFEQPQRQRRQRQSQPLPPPPPPPLAPQGLQLWSLWFHHGGLGRQPHWNRSRNRLLVFRFRAFRSRSWALALEGLGL
mgnify:CR=1 FL=1